MNNPFVYGEAVTGKNFCDRVEEINKLKIDLANSQKIFVISARKMGKTSLMKTVLGQIKNEGLVTVFIDMESFSSYKEFLDVYFLALMEKFTTPDKIVGVIRNVLPGLRVEFKLDELGRPLISLGYSRTEPELDKIASKIYNLPNIIAKKRKRKVVVVFDEFQEILRLNGKQIEGIIRSVVQHQRDVGYVFLGSKRHMLQDMVNSPERPFYKMGPVMYLKKIPEENFFQFVKLKFLTNRVKISDETIYKIIRTAENNPYYVQMFCHELWDYGILKGEIKEQDIQVVINKLISQETHNFHLEWSRLILSKRRLLKAIATCGGRNVLSNEFLSKNELGYPSSVYRTLLTLTDEGYLNKEEDEYFFSDILFRGWIKKL